MKSCLKKLGVFLVVAGVCGVSFGFDLSGSVAVNQTSDTAANAKVSAMNQARRQILFNVLSKYSVSEDLHNLLQKASNEELMDLIVSSGVSGEQISSDTYSANVTMNLDNNLVKKWLDANGIKNWVPGKDSDEKFTAFIVIPNGIADWAELKRITREGNVDIETQSISGNQIVAKMPLNYRANFTASVREMGWKYTDNNGVLQVWK